MNAKVQQAPATSSEEPNTPYEATQRLALTHIHAFAEPHLRALKPWHPTLQVVDHPDAPTCKRDSHERRRQFAIARINELVRALNDPDRATLQFARENTMVLAMIRSLKTRDRVLLRLACEEALGASK